MKLAKWVVCLLASLSFMAHAESGSSAMHNLAATYGVRKLVSDPPHWSVNGR